MLRFKGILEAHGVNPDGTRWREVCRNTILDEALNYALRAVLKAGSNYPAFYFGLIDQTSYSALAQADTMASHPTWIENQSYPGLSRVQWTPADPAGQLITHTATSLITVNADVNLMGAFLCTDSLKSSNTGLLWMTSLFSVPRRVLSAGQLRLGYTCRAVAGAV